MDALEFALSEDHVMDPSRDRLVITFRALLIQGISLCIEYDENHPDFPISGEHMGSTILLADDSLTIQKVVELTFSDTDHEVVAVSRNFPSVGFSML